MAAFSLLATYVGVQSTQSADAAVIIPSDCGSLDSLSVSFLNTLTDTDAVIDSDIASMNSNGPSETGMAAALRLDQNITVDLTEWTEQQVALEDTEHTLDCDTVAYPNLETAISLSESEVSEIQDELKGAENTVVETIVSEEDGYDPCTDTASVHAAIVTDGSSDKGTQANTLAGNVVKVDLSESKYPESAQHIKDAIAGGAPTVLTLDRKDPPGTASKDQKCNKRRKLSLKGIKTQKGKDRDEYPFAMTKEGGTGASVRLIDPSDNRGAGSTIGNALRDQPDDTQFEINLVP